MRDDSTEKKNVQEVRTIVALTPIYFLSEKKNLYQALPKKKEPIHIATPQLKFYLCSCFFFIKLFSMIRLRKKKWKTLNNSNHEQKYNSFNNYMP